jgi:hypothetical protein
MDTSQNRFFVLIALGLVGFLVIGMLGLGGYVLLSRLRRASVRPTPTAVIAQEIELPTQTPTPVPTFTPVPPPPTPTVAATNTPVIRPEAGQPSGQVPTPAAAAQEQPAGGAAPTETPQEAGEEATPTTGFGATEALLLGLGLGAVVVVARRLRLAG